MEDIEYKENPVFPNLICGSDGSIYSKLQRRNLKGYVNQYGYIAIFHLGKQLKAHRIIAQAFLGISDLPIDHINMVKTDNRLCNLEYVTHSINIERAWKKDKNRKPSGLIGDKNPNAKLSSEDYFKIIELKGAGETSRNLSLFYKVSVTQINRIIAKKARIKSSCSTQ